MRPISEHSGEVAAGRRTPPASFLSMAHKAASRRAATRRDRDEVVAETVDELLAEGGHDGLLLGAVDTEAWRAREQFAALVTSRLTARLRPDRSAPGRLLDDHVALELDARFPALSDRLQAELETWETTWGCRRDLWGDITIPGLPGTGSALLAVTRDTSWPASALNGGAPTELSANDDSALLRMPHQATVHRVHGQWLVELWMWPVDAEARSGWRHTWLLLQDGARLVPARTAEVAADVLDARLPEELARLAAAAADWWDVLERRHRAIAGAYFRDGMHSLAGFVRNP